MGDFFDIIGDFLFDVIVFISNVIILAGGIFWSIWMLIRAFRKNSGGCGPFWNMYDD